MFSILYNINAFSAWQTYGVSINRRALGAGCSVGDSKTPKLSCVFRMYAYDNICLCLHHKFNLCLTYPSRYTKGNPTRNSSFFTTFAGLKVQYGYFQWPGAIVGPAQDDLARARPCRYRLHNNTQTTTN